MAIYVEAVSAEPLPMGKYVAVVSDVVRDDNSQYGPQLRWVFRVADGDYAGRELYAWSALRDRATDRSKLVRWYRTLTGITPTGKFDVESVIGKRCIIKVVEKTREDGTVINKIDDIDPYTSKQRVQAQKAMEPPDTEPDPFA